MRDLERLCRSWRLHLDAKNLSPRTIQSYLEAAERMGEFLYASGHSGDVATISRRDVEGFISDQLDKHSPATAAVRYRSVKQLFVWLVLEGEISVSPMEGMRQPREKEKVVPVLNADELSRLVAACSGRGFTERRDEAIVRMLVDTGIRASELLGMSEDRLNLEERVALVLGKGNRERVVPFGTHTTQALDRYLRVRGRHDHAVRSELWLGERGRLGPSGLASMLRRRSRQAGIGHVHPHQLRHTFAHRYLSAGGTEGDLMQLGGWRSREMLSRYGASAATSRAHEAFRQLSLGDQF